MATNAAIDVTGGLAPVATSGSAADLTTGTLPLARLSGITDAQIAAANKDGIAGTASMRTLGTGAQQAAAGNDSRLSDSRAPSGSAGGDLTGTYPNPTLAAVITAGGPTGSSNVVPVITYDAKGRLTAVSTATITPAAIGAPAGSGSSSGTNTGDQTITLTGGVTGSGTGSFAATVVTNANLTGEVTSVGNAATLNLTGLTAGYPVLADSLPFYDLSATANRKTTIALANAICSHYPGGRLSISSSTPFGITTSTGTSSLYYVPVSSSYIVLHDGTTWVQADFGTSIPLTVSGGTSGKNYDVWCYLSGTTPTLGLSAAWTNDTTRSEALALSAGIWHKNGDASRRYLGTIRLVSTTTFAHSQAQRFMWNLYHQRPLSLRYVDSTASWTYGSAAWRQARNQTAAKVEFVVGMDDAMVDVELYALGSISAAAQHWIGLGLDTLSPTLAQPHTVTTAGELQHAGMAYRDTPGIGYHYLSWNEYSNATGTHTFYGYANGSYESSLKGWVMG